MRILLVEDDVQMGPTLQNALSQAGYAVDLSVDGIDAEGLGDIEPYDLIVLDLGLPKRSGMEVLQNWRNRNNHVPVVILTARGSWEEKVQGLKRALMITLLSRFRQKSYWLGSVRCSSVAQVPAEDHYRLPDYCLMKMPSPLN